MTFSKVLRQSLLWRSLYFITLFIVNLVLSRYLQANGSGVIYYLSNTFIFIHLVASLSLETGITYFGASGRISTNKLLWLCLLWTTVVVLLQMIAYRILPVSSEQLSSQRTAQYAFCYITGLLLTTYCINVFYVRGDFLTTNLILSLLNLLFAGFVYTAYSILHSISKTVITDVYFYSFLVQGLLVAFVCLIKNKSWREFSLPDRKETAAFAKYSLTALLFNILLFLVYRVDYLFVRYSPACTPSDLGNYIQASKLGQMMLIVPQIINSTLYPQISSGKDIENISRFIIVLIKGVAFLFFLFFVFIFFTGNQLFPFIFGDTFDNVRLPFLLLLPGIFGLSVVSFLSSYFSGQGNVSLSVKAAFLGLVIVVAGDFAFVSRYGIIAAAAVSMVGYLVMCSPYVVLFVKERKLSYPDFFRFRKNDWLLLSSIWKRREK